ncbi:glycosyltransferase family 4 protein [Arsenicibacter rosenii]|uniref:Glycosyl transferase family 1 domain-containing protein n=1 Tax=Arsenicibacter rosenii TaxID=1750698 RepID=A0A1S2VCW8_9BACT|nr:glycosyltransferase family 1 protein [Arsenicibacter rosenii]OIN56519.1 hypothetical protein BLX24_24700 [Arsenicibacter rosenii]
MKLSVCIDARMINNSGIGVYILNHIKNYLYDDEIELILIGDKNNLIACLGSSFTRAVIIEDLTQIYTIKEQISLYLQIPECDIFWSPHYNIPLLPVKARKRLVTIHDTYHLTYASTLSLPQRIYSKLVLSQAVTKSDAIICDSYFTRDEIKKHFPDISLDPFVIHLGIDHSLYRKIDDTSLKDRLKSKYQVPDNYILFVGNVKPNKNLSTLVKALGVINKQGLDRKLVIIGKREGFIGKDDTLTELLNNDYELSRNVIFTGFVENEDLPILYNLASVFVFPSLYEGFGFPPLEAMACGCPVVASNFASIPEVCGNAAFYINPNSAESIANGILSVLNDNELRNKLVLAGLKHVHRYLWSDTVSETKKILVSLCKK